MKATFTIFLSLMALHLHAQDVIVKKDDSTILAKVLEVTETNIKYKKHSNQTGPTYTISIENVRAINYQNGEKEDYSSTNTNTATSTVNANNGLSPQYIKKPADNRNAELLAFYNRTYQPSAKVKQKSKIAKKMRLLYMASSHHPLCQMKTLK